MGNGSTEYQENPEVSHAHITQPDRDHSCIFPVRRIRILLQISESELLESILYIYTASHSILSSLPNIGKSFSLHRRQNLIQPLIPLAASEQALHQTAVRLCHQHRQLEWQIIEALQQIDRRRLFKKFGATSVFKYAIDILGLSESVAYNFISVARKADKVPALADAIKSEQLSASKAGRIVAALDPQNAAKLIEFARTHTARDTDREVARINPKAVRCERVTELGRDLVEVRITVSRDVFEKWQRCQDLVSRKKGKRATLSETLSAGMDSYAKHNDPVEAAERALERKARSKSANTTELCAYRVGANRFHKQTSDPVTHRKSAKHRGPARSPLTAEQRHSVFQRDQGRCTFKDQQGRRCENQTWLHIHHIVPVTHGGGNEPTNLTTLCSSHHDLAHQLSLPIEGQVTWLRSPSVRYR